MSDDEGFPARWSRRKRDAVSTTREQPRPESAASETHAAPLPPSEAQPVFDPVSLPPIETIGAGSDIRAFLSAGVPADLARAALRRAWSADPAIRDFVGLSENSWDFNAPGGVPGFGAVTAQEVRRLLAQAMGEAEAADPAPPAAQTPSPDQVTEPVRESGPPAELTGKQPVARESPQDQPKHDRDTSAGRRDPTPGGKVSAGMQHVSGEREYSPPLSRRGHGGALPE